MLNSFTASMEVRNLIPRDIGLLEGALNLKIVLSYTHQAVSEQRNGVGGLSVDSSKGSKYISDRDKTYPS
ncbi:hypothetical protein AQUCO_00900006v1 [Aquilegia coerulea]|uniref:Uncharacterized protein n=1 Tax=Aquilegia coerulea TaxID=218851 RepID=A0A2G5EBJ9_AQUCA|nr:hypothetical protein AQUCO_00900006v1 [Aquilegia coerulea]